MPCDVGCSGFPQRACDQYPAAYNSYILGIIDAWSDTSDRIPASAIYVDNTLRLEHHSLLLTGTCATIVMAMGFGGLSLLLLLVLTLQCTSHYAHVLHQRGKTNRHPGLTRTTYASQFQYTETPQVYCICFIIQESQ